MDIEKMKQLLKTLKDDQRFALEKINALESFKASEDYDMHSPAQASAINAQIRALQDYMTALICRVQDLQIRIEQNEDFDL